MVVYSKQMIQDIQLRLSPCEASENDLILKGLLKVLKINESEINDWRVVKRSIDARKRNVVINLTIRIATGGDNEIAPVVTPIVFKQLPADAPGVIVVGAGPAGLFAALQCIRNGIKPILLERGRSVDERRRDIADISRNKEINSESNYCFGEVGAGAYSDGKLFTRSKKRGNVDEVLQLLVQHGAKSDILIDAHPHIGSDRLPDVIKSIRETINAAVVK